MANPGAGNKFASVNLNKSYGHRQHHHSSSYSSRTSQGPNGHHHGGGGMVVLSRPRSSQKTGPKLSVPPPMNLPSLRKEHEKFDSLGAGGGPSGGGVPGSGLRPSSSGMRWTKPVTLQEKDGLCDSLKRGGVDGLSSKGVGSTVHSSISGAAYVAFEKSPVLRGEDFPSLKATLPAASGPAQKLKDCSTDKQKQVAAEVVTAISETMEGPNLSSHIDMRPKKMSSCDGFSNGVHENESEDNHLGSSRMLEQSKKEDNYFAGPLPLVCLNPRSDWADDERDTSCGLTDRGKNYGFVRSEDYSEGDFDVPKVRFLPLKSGHSSFDLWAMRGSEIGKSSSSELPKAEPHGRNAQTLSWEGREGNSWRTSSPLSKVNISMQEAEVDRNGFAGMPSSISMEIEKDSRCVRSLSRDGLLNDTGRNGQGGKLPWSNMRDCYGSDHILHNDLTYKASIGVKVPPFTDGGPKFTKEKCLISKSEKSYSEDFLKDFGDRWDPLSGNLLGVVKRKKDVLKDADIYDPVRESFEAELERVQKMQEQERQRIMEENERALELARREEEQRARLAREQEERQRRLEEAAQEAAWRAEQERLEALRKAEEQRIAREDEKRRILMEEERRKEAAKQKLLELEERIAKRQADVMRDGCKSSLVDKEVSNLPKENDSSGFRETQSFMSDGVNWEESARMVERITAPASSDSSNLNKPIDMTSTPNMPRDNSSFLTERGKPTNPWKRDPFENSNFSTFAMTEQESNFYCPKHDASFGGNSSSRKEFYGDSGFGMPKTYSEGGTANFQMDAYSQMRGHKWSLVDGDPLNKNTDIGPEFPENLADKFGDAAWEHGHPHSNSNSLYPEHYYHQSEADAPRSFGRSRQSRQPRVPPPPSLASMRNNKNPHRGENEQPRPSSFLDGIQHNRTGRMEPTVQVSYDADRYGNVKVESVDPVVEQKPDEETAPRCDSQSSLSVSSPPVSPVHLSHDDLDESGDYPVKSAAREDGDFLMTGKGQTNIVNVPSSVSSSTDDGEWVLQNNAKLQEQEEYDEDEEQYREDEVRDGEDENIYLSEEFEDMHLEDKTSASMMDSLVLGFNEDVGVRMPNNELDISSLKEVTSFPAQAVSAEEEDSLQRDAHAHLNADGSSQAIIDQQGTEAGMQAAAIRPNDNGDYSSEGHIRSSNQAAPSGNTSLASQAAGQFLMPSSPAFSTQAEIPVKLQFGLFSGPSLIPTPIPAIQIGSIQMPLHLHPESLGPVHSSQPPLFQFGQLRYTSPISAGVVPLASQSMSFLHPSVPENFPLQKNPGGPVSMLPGEDASAYNPEELNSPSIAVSTERGLVPRPSDLSQGHVPKEATSLPASEKREHLVMIQRGQVEHPAGKSNSMSNFPAEEQEVKKEASKKNRFLSNTNEGEGHAQIRAAPLQGKQDKDFAGSKGNGSITNGRGKHYIFKVKNVSTKPTFPDSEASQWDAAGHQRRQRRMVKRAEFRVRDNGEKRQSSSFCSSDQLGLGDGSNMNRRNAVAPGRTGSRKAVMKDIVSKCTLDSECKQSVSINSPYLGSGTMLEMDSRKESMIKGQMAQQSCSVERSSKGDTREEDVDSPLQSGVVHVFQQPGIEAPSDEDDFIEVRSKRQMLNDKREQREKEIKAKSRVSKVARRSHSSSNARVFATLKTTAPRGEGTGSGIPTNFAGTEGWELADLEVPPAFNSNVSPSQQLAPIGTPPTKSDASADLRCLKASSVPFASDTSQNFVLGPGFAFEDKNVDSAQTSSDSWSSPGINQPVMALTQSQLDEAMKPANFDSCISVGDHTIAVSEHVIPSSSVLAKDRQFSSAASPINSLLAGEKIQFGAVTSPTILPLSNHLVSHGVRHPGSCQPDNQVSHEILPAENNCDLFFVKEKDSDDSCAHLEDCEAEAEAEAAASAVAVAAISNDEIIGNGLGALPLSVSDTKSYGTANADGIAEGVAGEQQSANKSRTEEPLSVSLPADLCIESSPTSLWPPLTSSQTTSSQMLSHFPSGPPSHFPFYDMNVNAMMGSPIFAFRPNEESSAVSPSNTQKSGEPSSGPHATWHRSNMDSFYGGPMGFTGPFIGPGGIPGVQAPPHMVVYNHFAPVGQFGQVGLSFMGTTFIASGKQHDWKHNPAGPGTTAGEGDVNNLNTVSAQQRAISMASPVQHLAPGSSFVPMASPLPMFDVSSFQSSPELLVHARWPPVPTSTLQSVSTSVSMQQQAESLLPPLSHQYPINNNAPAPVEQSVATSGPAESSQDFHLAAATDLTATQLPDGLGLVEDSSGFSSSKQASTAVRTSADSGKIDAPNGNNKKTGGSAAAPFSTHFRSSQHYRGSSASSSGYSNNYRQRGAGFLARGRNHSAGTEKEKGFSTSSVRMKQIYVAKQRNQSAAL